MSDRFNAAAQRLGAAAAHLQDPAAVDPSTANLKQIERQMAQARDDFDVLREELRRKRMHRNLVVGSLFLAALLAMAAPRILRLLVE